MFVVLLVCCLGRGHCDGPFARSKNSSSLCDLDALIRVMRLRPE
jgi:hypothetical protein